MFTCLRREAVAGASNISMGLPFIGTWPIDDSSSRSVTVLPAESALESPSLSTPWMARPRGLERVEVGDRGLKSQSPADADAMDGGTALGCENWARAAAAALRQACSTEADSSREGSPEALLLMMPLGLPESCKLHNTQIRTGMSKRCSAGNRSMGSFQHMQQPVTDITICTAFFKNEHVVMKGQPLRI